MANPSGGANFRGDLLSFLQEANDATKMLIGLKVAPAAPVPTKTGQYPAFRVGSGLLLNATLPARGQDGSYPRINRRYELATYSTTEYGLEEPVDDGYRADMARFFEAEKVAARQVELNLLLSHEKRVATEILGSGLAAQSAAAAYTEANITNGTLDFAADVQAAIDTLSDNGVVPTHLVISSRVWNRVTRSTRFQNFVKAFNAGVSVISEKVGSDALREAFGVELLVGKAAENTSKTTTKSLSPIWGTSHFAVVKVASGAPEAGGVMRTFAFDGDGGILVPESYRDEARRSEIVRVRHTVDEALVDASAGIRVTTSYA